MDGTGVYGTARFFSNRLGYDTDITGKGSRTDRNSAGAMETTGISVAWQEKKHTTAPLIFLFCPRADTQATICRDGINADRNAMDYIIEKTIFESAEQHTDPPRAGRWVCNQTYKKLKDFDCNF